MLSTKSQPTSEMVPPSHDSAVEFSLRGKRVRDVEHDLLILARGELSQIQVRIINEYRLHVTAMVTATQHERTVELPILAMSYNHGLVEILHQLVDGTFHQLVREANTAA